MGNGKVTGISVNTKAIILILLFVDIGFTIKMTKKYYAMREAGYGREKTFEEQMGKRVMMSFGSVEGVNRIVEDAISQKEEAKKVATFLKEQNKGLKHEYKRLTHSETQLSSERSLLLKEIDGLKENLNAAEKEIASLKRKILKLQPL